jgi:uncharacterized membrane protein YsdA (DUF1294 family)
MDLLRFLEGHLAAFSAGQLLLYFVAINLVTFMIYGADKRAAIQQAPRVPEKALHALALCGGTPAAWLAQRHFRHKTRKGSFQAVFWLIVVVQVIVLGGLLIQ